MKNITNGQCNCWRVWHASHCRVETYLTATPDHIWKVIWLFRFCKKPTQSLETCFLMRRSIDHFAYFHCSYSSSSHQLKVAMHFTCRLILYTLQWCGQAPCRPVTKCSHVVTVLAHSVCYCICIPSSWVLVFSYRFKYRTIGVTKQAPPASHFVVINKPNFSKLLDNTFSRKPLNG
jgi:hypothetical protein